MIGAGSKDGWIQTSTKCAEEGIVRLSYRNEWGGGGGGGGGVFEHRMKQHLLPYVVGNSWIVIDRAPAIPC